MRDSGALCFSKEPSSQVSHYWRDPSQGLCFMENGVREAGRRPELAGGHGGETWGPGREQLAPDLWLCPQGPVASFPLVGSVCS
jgi:hypothetical protein